MKNPRISLKMKKKKMMMTIKNPNLKRASCRGFSMDLPKASWVKHPTFWGHLTEWQELFFHASLQIKLWDRSWECLSLLDLTTLNLLWDGCFLDQSQCAHWSQLWQKWFVLALGLNLQRDSNGVWEWMHLHLPSKAYFVCLFTFDYHANDWVNREWYRLLRQLKNL